MQPIARFIEVFIPAYYFPDTVEPELRRYPKRSEIPQLLSSAGFDQIFEELVEFAYVRKEKPFGIARNGFSIFLVKSQYSQPRNCLYVNRKNRIVKSTCLFSRLLLKSKAVLGIVGKKSEKGSRSLV